MSLNFKCFIDGTEYTIPQLKMYEYGRAIHMLHEMKDLGVKVMNGDVELTHRDINYLTMEEAHRISVETRWNLGPDGVEAVIADNLKDSDVRWKAWNAVPIEEQGYQYCVVEFDIEGMPIPMMQKEDGQGDERGPKSTMLHAALRQKLEVNPEHYIPGRAAEGDRGSVEVVGMYGEPICMIPGKVTRGVPTYMPYQADPAYPICSTVELNHEDGTPCNLGVTHEFMIKSNGFKQKATYFCPKNAPKELPEGHKIHFAIEMLNDYTIAYENYIKSQAEAGQ